MKRTLGRTGIEVSAMGLGSWAIGGPWTMYGGQAGWGTVDDAESTRAIHQAIELGVTFFDTAATYGAGHSERVLGQAIKGRRDQIIGGTKFGYNVNETTKEVVHYGSSDETSEVASHIRSDLEDSLRRLDTDYIDIYQLHVGGLPVDKALEVRDVLEKLVAEGKIRTYGWSTDRIDAAEAFSTSPKCGIVQQALSVMEGNLELLALCERLNLASINRSPLGMGLLTGKFTQSTTFGNDDLRKGMTWHPAFRDGKPSKNWLDALDSVREVLTSDGRTLAQGSLAWIWAKSPNTIPVPGFRNVKQAEENALAMAKGPLTAKQMAEIDRLLGRKGH